MREQIQATPGDVSPDRLTVHERKSRLSRAALVMRALMLLFFSKNGLTKLLGTGVLVGATALRGMLEPLWPAASRASEINDTIDPLSLSKGERCFQVRTRRLPLMRLLEDPCGLRPPLYELRLGLLKVLWSRDIEQRFCQLRWREDTVRRRDKGRHDHPLLLARYSSL